MCGIVGIFDFKKSDNSIYNKISNALNIQKHRGPDDTGIFLSKENNFCIGMNRLSIVDIKNGQQPFFSNDKNHCIIFNGEIVNSKKLKDKYFYNRDNFFFRSKNSDTELLLNLLILKGENCIEELNGMFAFCYVNLKEKKILLVRDRFGIKPLYYSFKENSFGFASEIQTLTSLYESDLKINVQSLYDYLSLMYIPSPQTIYHDFFCMRPGEQITIDLNKGSIDKSFWHNHKFIPNNNLTKKDVSEEIYRLTEKALLEWTQSDVPLCNSLSGGLDSSVISSVFGKKNYDISNYSIGFLDNEDKLFDELKLAKKISNKWCQKHYIKKINSEVVLNEIDAMVESLHQPYGGGIPSWIVYKEISYKFKVTFNGTGIDEFFGNYGKWINLNSIFSKKIKFKNFEKNFFNKRYYASTDEKKQIINFKKNNLESTSEKFFAIYSESDDDSKINNSALLDIKTQLPDEFLNVCDTFSMKHSLEVRPPYLDNELTNFFFSIPSDLRVGPKNNLKKFFKDTFDGILPKDILNAKKRGFILPVENWFKKDMRFLLEKYLSKEKLNEHGLFKNNLLEDLVYPFMNRGAISSKLDKFHRKQTLIWGILFFQFWFEKHVNKKKIKI